MSNDGFVGQDLNLSASFHREIARSPMVTIKNIREKPFNSGSEGKLLLDELILPLHHNERMDILQGDVFTDIHKKTSCCDMCKMFEDAGCEFNKKSFMQELTVKNNVGGGKIGVC